MIGHRVNRHADPLLEILFGKKKKPQPESESWTPIPEPLPGPQLVFDSGIVLPLPENLKTGLEIVRRRENLGRWIEGLSIFLTAVLLLLMGQVLLDWIFGLPWLVRVAFLGLDIVVLKLLWQQVGANFFGAPLNDEEAALRVEKHFGFMDGALIGAVELAGGKPGATQGSAGLLQALIDEAADKCTGIEMTDAVPLGKAWQWGGAALAVLGLAIFLSVTAFPASGILLQRLLLLNPDSPSGTKVEKVTEDITLQEGAAAVLAAKALGFVPPSGHVQLVYLDGSREDVPVTVSSEHPDIFSVTIPGVQQTFRYRFFLHDAEGPEYWVKIETPPAIQALKRENAEIKGKPAGEAAVSGRIYWEEGSQLKLALTATSSLKSAALTLETKGKKVEIPMKIEGFGRKIARVEIPETQRDADHFFIELVGENNVKSVERVVYSLERVLSPRALEEADSRKSSGPATPAGQEMRAKDRAALFNLQSEPIPDEYTAMVRQYLKNVSGNGGTP